MTTRHTLTPLRALIAVAPSGGHVRLAKYSESDRELSWWQGKLTAVEDAQFWKAKLKAERPGVDMWDQARALLVAAGWRVTDE
jgi:hypothetical protein